MAAALFNFDNTYARELTGCYTAWQPAAVPAPRWLQFNRALAEELGLDPEALQGDAGLAVLAGNAVPAGAEPLAQAYAGHQFGQFSPQLGDGRALLLGELIDRHGQRRDMALKGSGRTPFSRGGDGKAAVGPVLREYLLGEAMHALGVPTTRVLAAVATGEPVYRDRPLPGAVLTRVAASHVRVGTFEFFAAREQVDALRRLLQYVVARHYPALADQHAPALALLRAVADRQAALVAQWMGVGFIHGVMNTDNMTLSGETIDYGPCAFLEHYDPAAKFSSIDHHGRYAFGRQPHIARWNIARLAESLLPLMGEDPNAAAEQATDVVSDFPAVFQRHWLAVMRAKLGLAAPAMADAAQDEADLALAQDFLGLLQAEQADFTLGFRDLAGAWQPGAEADAGRSPERQAWLARWRQRLAAQPANDVAAALKRANPLHVPRNHLVEEALEAAVEREDLAPFQALLAVLQRPFDDQPGRERYAQPAPREATACYRTFCGT